MPIYEYTCQACEADFEALVFGSDTVCCPECESEEIKRKMSTFAHKTEGEGGGMSSSAGSGCAGCSSTNCASCQ